MMMQLIADRFVVRADGHSIDLATGETVTLIVSAAGGPTDQRRWAARCAWFERLSHPSLAALIDYGLTGESRRFEAWRCVPVRDEPAFAAEAAAAAPAFLRACGLTAVDGGSRAWGIDRGGHVVAIPASADGYDSGGAPPEDRDWPISNCGVVRIERPAIGAVAELFEIQPTPSGEPQLIGIWGPGESGRTSAVLDLARSARLNGLVPIAARLTASPLARLLDGRTALVIDDDSGTHWRIGLVRAALRSPRPHIVIVTSREDPAGMPAVALRALAADRLAAAVRPAGLRLDKRVLWAAARADGAPGRFVRTLHGARDGSGDAHARAIPVAAERAPVYGLEDHAVEPPPVTSAWVDQGEVARLRKELAAAEMLLAAGRHASGERGVRAAVGALARRGDWIAALRGSRALATSFLLRGRPHDARTVIDAAREYSDRTADADAVASLAVLAGVAWTDLARLGEAESVLGAVAAGDTSVDATRVQVALAVARCRFWQARYADADRALDGLSAGATLDRAWMVRIQALRARIAVGRLDFSRAMSCASDAVLLADALLNPGLIARARCAAAFAHLAVGDLASLQRHVDACVAAARTARDHLQGWRARMLLVEQLRRAGRRPDALAAFRLVQRLAAVKLPPILRARFEFTRDLLMSQEGAAQIAVRHTAASGLPALALFGPAAAAGALAAVIDDAVAMLQACQDADEEQRALAAVCEQAQQRLGAAAVSFIATVQSPAARVAGSGARLDPAIGERAAAAMVPIAPHRLDDRVECAVPVRYGGAIIGALAARWTLNRSPEPSHSVTLLTMAATAAAPLLQAAISARARAAMPAAHGLLGVSAAIAEIRRAAERAAHAPFAVLVEGESGSGKELVARAVHCGGSRRDRPFRTLNCAALPDDLVESELFGHARGAFTGALAERVGVFEEAHSGTLLLDEIGELSLRAQAKLLRVLQEGELRRIGENVSRRIDVRIVAATNRNLRDEAAAGRFRVDLLYRLDVVRIHVPPLRERREDIPLLIDHFWREATGRLGSLATLGPPALAVLGRYDWPGNVRELQNVLAALAVRVGRRGVVGVTALPPQIGAPAPQDSWRLDAARRSFEDRFVRAALVRAGGSRTQAAAELGLSRQGLAKLMVRLGIAAGA
jgi:DNA-binding NtrC family response regulator